MPRGSGRWRALADCSRRMRAASCFLRFCSWRRARTASRSASDTCGARTIGPAGRVSAGGSLRASSCFRRSRMTGAAWASPATVEASITRVIPRPWRSTIPGSTARSWSLVGLSAWSPSSLMQSASDASVSTMARLSIVPSMRPLAAAARMASGSSGPSIRRSSASRWSSFRPSTTVVSSSSRRGPEGAIEQAEGLQARLHLVHGRAGYRRGGRSGLGRRPSTVTRWPPWCSIGSTRSTTTAFTPSTTSTSTSPTASSSSSSGRRGAGSRRRCG